VKPSIAIIDHYDSFTFNLLDWFFGDRLQILRVPYDNAQMMRKVAASEMPLILSPGPKTPKDVPQTLDLVAGVIGKRPVLGICLGHQVLGTIAGLSTVRARKPCHGATRRITAFENSKIFEGLPRSFEAACYNSLTLSGTPKSTSIKLIAKDDTDEIQGLALELESDYTAFGVQFHPESFMGDELTAIRDNWLMQVQAYFSTRYL
jgi:anthranilate synthase/aminodeoxychorismate synthase-like glutamine amidotransferase